MVAIPRSSTLLTCSPQPVNAHSATSSTKSRPRWRNLTSRSSRMQGRAPARHLRSSSNLGHSQGHNPHSPRSTTRTLPPRCLPRPSRRPLSIILPVATMLNQPCRLDHLRLGPDNQLTVANSGCCPSGLCPCLGRRLPSKSPSTLGTAARANLRRGGCRMIQMSWTMQRIRSKILLTGSESDE